MPLINRVGGAGEDTSDATAYAVDIRTGKTAYARGGKVVGTANIPNYEVYAFETTLNGTGSFNLASPFSGTSGVLRCYGCFKFVAGGTMGAFDNRYISESFGDQNWLLSQNAFRVGLVSNSNSVMLQITKVESSYTHYLKLLVLREF